MNLFDASALLCFLQGEDGADVVERELTVGGRCSAGNWSETAQKILQHEQDWDLARSLLLSYGVAVEPVQLDDAERAARLWRSRSGLSLGDRLCLATAERLQATVWTADTAWGVSESIKQVRPAPETASRAGGQVGGHQPGRVPSGPLAGAGRRRGRLADVTEPTTWLTLEQVAAAIDQSVVQVRRLLREDKLIAVRRDGATVVPADFVDGAALVKGLSGTLLLLHDAGYDAEEAIHWLYRLDDTLPGSPIQALRENRGSEVRRRAQAAGF